jgi:hypothetical protein
VNFSRTGADGLAGSGRSSFAGRVLDGGFTSEVTGVDAVEEREEADEGRLFEDEAYLRDEWEANWRATMEYRSMSECNLFPFQEGILDERIMSSEMNLWRELRSAEAAHRPQRTEDMLN